MRTLAKMLWIASLAAAGCPLLFAGPLERYFIYEQQRLSSTALPQVQTGYFSQRIDADSSESGSFQQRYYIDESYGKQPDSPVFFYICGEAACEASVLQGAIRDYAQKFHAKLVALEHRYYGKSQPFPNLSTENLRYLSTEAALDDLAYFQRWLQKEKGWQGKWIAFGGSYPGNLSAYYRLKYPYLVHGALASSAPVQAKESFSEYDKHVSQVAGPHCAAIMREVVGQVERSQADPNAFAAIKTLFGAEEVEDDRDFLYVIADVGAAAIQYGMRDAFCDTLLNGHDKLAAYADFAQRIYQRFDIRAVDLTPQAALREERDAWAEGIGLRQWFYQSCSEYGYWQVAHPDPSYSSRSSQIDLRYHQAICQRLFERTQPANTDYINQNFYIPLQNHLVQQIIFTNGSRDPWSHLSLTPAHPDANNLNLRYLLIDGSAHCDDLHKPAADDSAPLKATRAQIVAELEKWLA
ncbi:MAG: septum formation initiator [Legionellaceae bacterium]|nr:septum formation initiator [Legionellaceae bacterium]